MKYLFSTYLLLCSYVYGQNYNFPLNDSLTGKWCIVSYENDLSDKIIYCDSCKSYLTFASDLQVYCNAGWKQDGNGTYTVNKEDIMIKVKDFKSLYKYYFYNNELILSIGDIGRASHIHLQKLK